MREKGNITAVDVNNLVSAQNLHNLWVAHLERVVATCVAQYECESKQIFFSKMLSLGEGFTSLISVSLAPVLWERK